MSFDQLQSTWEALGEVDPLWAILSAPSKENNQWDPTAFFALGEHEVEFHFNEIEQIAPELTMGRALDFGCGIGRITRALGTRFQQVDGVDIAQSMVDHANKLHADTDNLTFHVNPRNDLTLFDDNTFDFVYSRLVLQHMAPQFAKQYIAEFIRILKPNGLIAFQLPAGLKPTEADAQLVHPYLKPSALCSAEITLHTNCSTLKANQQVDLLVTIKNSGNTTWQPSEGRVRINLGNHWLWSNHSMHIVDDGRTPIHHAVAPSEEIQLSLPIQAPAEPGEFLLELDIVKEDIAWFSEKGNPTLQLPVTVVLPFGAGTISRVSQRLNQLKTRLQPPPTPPENPLADKPQFEMHGIPPKEVLDIVSGANAQMSAIQIDGSASRDWGGYIYYITK